MAKKRCSGNLKRSYFSFLNDVISLFFLTLSVVWHPARCLLYHVTVFCEGPIDAKTCFSFVKRYKKSVAYPLFYE